MIGIGLEEASLVRIRLMGTSLEGDGTVGISSVGVGLAGTSLIGTGLSCCCMPILLLLYWVAIHDRVQVWGVWSLTCMRITAVP